MGVLDDLYAQAGLSSENTNPNSTAGRYFAGQPVVAGPELERILALPEYDWQADPRVSQLVTVLSRHLRRKDHVQLFPMQAAALGCLYELGRCSTVASLGTGKTLVSALAPTLLSSKRPVFLNYARLLDKTRWEFKQLCPDWRVCEDYEFLSVEKLSLANYADWLLRWEPDFICVDEAHSLSNAQGARFKRLMRFHEAHPRVPILLLTGTPGSESVRQYAHLQELLHGDASPLPRNYELDLMAQATDSEVRGIRRALGDLVRFSGGVQSLEAVRDGIGQRVARTRGNIYYRLPDGVDCSLYASAEKFDDAQMDDFIVQAREFGTLPDGRVFEEIYDTSLIAKQLGLGFAKVLDPMPPEPWAAARRAWGAYVRECVADESQQFDTPFQVSAAVRRGELDDGGLYAFWREIEPTFTPVHKTEWFSLAAVQWCVDWAQREGGLVWTTMPTFGRKFAEISGLPFFHSNGQDANKGSIEQYPGGPACLSFSANCLGRNLQDRWNKNLFVAPASSADSLDQAIGRTVRRGQKAEVVEVVFLLTVFENCASIHTARKRAETDRTLGKNYGSRLLLGDWNIPSEAEVSRWSGPRWRKVSG